MPESQTPRAFVIGDPVAHSKSPLIQNRWLARHDVAGAYEAIHVKPDALPAFVARVRAGEFVGGNVTLPHKEAVRALCDRLSPAARTIGAVNRLLREPDGTISGDNTDHYGFLANLDAESPGWDRKREGMRALVLGAGGAARAVVYALAQRGFSDIVIANRTLSRAESLAAAIGGRATTLDRFEAEASDADLLVNTTSLGMGGTAFPDLALGALPDTALVTDIVYTPIETPLLKAARARGLATVDGLGMLLHQAVPGFAAWFGVTPEVDADLRAAVVAAIGK